jgi:hypothetical protein
MNERFSEGRYTVTIMTIIITVHVHINTPYFEEKAQYIKAENLVTKTYNLQIQY